MDLTERKKQILKRVVEDYIAAAEPVGSKALAEEMGGSVSSATIRNELADLVEMGYLEQPHTSAGRIPTDFGYRAFVDNLLASDLAGDDERYRPVVDQLRRSARLLSVEGIPRSFTVMATSRLSCPSFSARARILFSRAAPMPKLWCSAMRMHHLVISAVPSRVRSSSVVRLILFFFMSFVLPAFLHNRS